MLLLGIGAGIYVLVCLNLFVFQRSIMYYPQPRSNEQGSVLLSSSTKYGIINVSAHPHPGTSAVIYFGGNAEDVSQTVPDLADAFPNRALYALHYPGFGGSSGKTDQETIFAEALDLFDNVFTDHTDVTVIGRSLGSGVAVWVASQRPVSRLVLVTPFDSFADPASAQYPFVPVRWLLRDKYESWRYAPKVKAPTLIIVAGDDELVPRSSSDRLLTRFAPGIATETVLPGVGHNTIQDSPGYWPLLKAE
jgi:pimeloyl-ACP methyl ester carboxylesterase